MQNQKTFHSSNCALKALAAVCAVSVLFLACSTALAQETIAEYYVDQGVKRYEKGEYRKAINELSKALLIEPEHKKALEYLQKMGLEGGIYGKSMQPAEGNEYSNTVASLKEENWSQNVLNYKLKEDRERLVQKLKTKQRQLNDFMGIENPSEDEYGEYLGELDELESDYDDYDSMVMESGGAPDAEIEKLRFDIVSLGNKLTQKQNQMEKKMKHISNKYENEIINSAQANDVLTNLKQQLIEYRKLLRNKDKELSAAERKVARIRKTGKQGPDGKIEWNDKTKEEFSSLKKLLAQKEKEISGLMKDLDQKSTELNKITSQSKKSMANGLKPQQSGQEDKEGIDVVKLLKRRDKCIAELKQKLADSIRKLRALKKQPTETAQQQARQLEGEIKDLRGQLSDAEKSLGTKDDDITVLENRLKDAQEQLDLVRKIIQEKEQQIKELSDQINQMQFAE